MSKHAVAEVPPVNSHPRVGIPFYESRARELRDAINKKSDEIAVITEELREWNAAHTCFFGNCLVLIGTPENADALRAESKSITDRLEIARSEIHKLMAERAALPR